MEDMLNEHLLMSLKHQTSNFIESVKTKAIEVVADQHDKRLLLITILTLFFACYLIVFFSGYLWKERKSRKLKRVLTRSMSIGVLHGGELALQRLVDFHKVKANLQVLDSTETKLDALLKEERPNFKKLQRCIAKMEMSGKEIQALMKLEAAVRVAQSEGKPHEAYEFDMLLVETLIYQGEFNEALTYKCLKDEFITDARRPLYKAIIYLSLGHSTKGEAINCWNEFTKIREELKRPRNVKDAQLLDISTDFLKFDTVVKALKKDIQEVKRKAKKNK